MSNRRLLSITHDYRARVLRVEQAGASVLEGAHRMAVATIQPAIQRLMAQIREKREAGEDVPLSWLYEQNRLQVVEQLITGQMSHFGALAEATVGRLQLASVQLGQTAAQAQLQATVPAGVAWSFGVPSFAAIQAITASPLHNLFSAFGPDAAEGARDALITGVSTGMSPRTIAPLIQQALGVPRWKALTISRSETLKAYRQSQLANFRVNDDVCDGWTWICSLVNSCGSCIAMHGTFHSLDEDLDDHPNGGCVACPHTKSWADILDGTGIDTSDLEDTSLDVQSGADWFNEQDETKQRKILGPGKFDLYQKDALSLDDLVGTSASGSIYEKPLKVLR